MIYAINQEKLESCDLMFAPKTLEHIGVLDRKGLEKAYAIGYEHAIQELEKAFGKNQ